MKAWALSNCIADGRINTCALIIVDQWHQMSALTKTEESYRTESVCGSTPVMLLFY